MNEKEYLRELDKITTARKNMITRAVNAKETLEESGAVTEIEKLYYEHLFNEAVALEQKHGIWPVFEMWEIDYDDPILDIYHD